jgi:hypothetical protein
MTWLSYKNIDADTPQAPRKKLSAFTSGHSRYKAKSERTPAPAAVVPLHLAVNCARGGPLGKSAPLIQGRTGRHVGSEEAN